MSDPTQINSNFDADTEAPEILGDADEKTLLDYLKARMTGRRILLLELQSAFS